MRIIENIICHFMNKIFKLFKRRQFDAREKARITKTVLGIIGFAIETTIILAISVISHTETRSLLFILVFGAVRMNSAEHYKYWLKCITGTTLIYTFTLIMWLYFSYNFYTDVIWILAVSVYFRKRNACNINI